MSLAAPLHPPSPALLHLPSFGCSPDLLISCCRPRLSWASPSAPPALLSPRDHPADRDHPPQRPKPSSHTHRSKTLSSPRHVPSSVFDSRAADRVIACASPDNVAASRTPLRKKRPAKLDIPEAARLASLQKASLFLPGEQQISRRHVDHFVAVVAKTGLKDCMEDSYLVSTDFQGDPNQAFFGVFDGHGGKQAAQFAATHLSQKVSAALRERQPGLTCVEDAIHAAYQSTDAEFLNQHQSSGACAVSVLLKEGEMVISNAGDCKAVLSKAGQAECLSTLHLASNKAERQRVESLGGFVDCYKGIWRLQGSLAVTRGFGDARLKRWVCAEPAIARRNISNDCEFLILASDGLWDQLGEQEAVDCARKVFLEAEMDGRSGFLAPISTRIQTCASSCFRTQQSELRPSSSVMNACEELIRLSSERGNRDDITVMIVLLKSFATANQYLLSTVG